MRIAVAHGEVDDPDREGTHQAAFHGSVEIDGKVVLARLEARDAEMSVRLRLHEPVVERIEIGSAFGRVAQASLQPFFQSKPFAASHAGGSMPGRRATM